MSRRTLENIGTHDAETLRHWRERFHAEEERVRGLGSNDTFERLWESYLGYCKGVLGTAPYSATHAPLTELDQLA